MRLALSLSTGNHCQVTLNREEEIGRLRDLTWSPVTLQWLQIYLR
jgi:hypothetical protein